MATPFRNRIHASKERLDAAIRDKDGNLVFVTRADCPIHGEKAE